MNSMTGFGKSRIERQGKEISVEIKSVNHRYLDINIKMPRIFNAYEDLVRKTVSNSVSRGHLDIFINYIDRDTSNKQVVVDFALAEEVIDKTNQLAKQFGLKNDFQLNALVKTPDILTYIVKEEEENDLNQLLIECVNNALCALNKMRLDEGTKLTTIMKERLAEISKCKDSISFVAPQVAKEYAEKLSIRLTEALNGVDIDKARLVNEIAFFVDRSNIDEELDRLTSHIHQCGKFLSSDIAIGRKLDFLIQEMNREANTICSKCNNLAVTRSGVDLKNEIEKLREQCQNIE
ncbi:MAG: YicC/YloC family endoribonuclease [Clostridia bacterium]